MMHELQRTRAAALALVPGRTARVLSTSSNEDAGQVSRPAHSGYHADVHALHARCGTERALLCCRVKSLCRPYMARKAPRPAALLMGAYAAARQSTSSEAGKGRVSATGAKTPDHSPSMGARCVARIHAQARIASMHTRAC